MRRWVQLAFLRSIGSCVAYEDTLAKLNFNYVRLGTPISFLFRLIWIRDPKLFGDPPCSILGRSIKLQHTPRDFGVAPAFDNYWYEILIHTIHASSMHAARVVVLTKLNYGTAFYLIKILVRYTILFSVRSTYTTYGHMTVGLCTLGCKKHGYVKRWSNSFSLVE